MGEPMSPAKSDAASRIRRLWWGVFPVLVIVDLLVIALGQPVATEALVSYVLTYFTPMYLTVGSSLLLALRLKGVERRYWALMAAGVGMLVIPETYWVWYETVVDFRGPQIPNWVELGHLGTLVVLYILIVSMTRFGEAPLVSRVRFYLDVLAGGIVAFAAVYWFWTLPVFLHLPMGGWPVAVVAAVYPVSGALVLLTVGAMVLGWKPYKWRMWERLVTMQFTMYGLGMTVFPFMYSDWLSAPVRRGFDLYTVVWGFGHYMVFMASVYRAMSDEEGVRAKQWHMPNIGAVWLPILYPSLIALAWLVLGLSAIRVAGSTGGGVLAAATGVLAIVLIVRSWVSGLELAHLRERSITDSVTGTFNQRHLYDRLPRELAEATAEGLSASVIAFDVADFREIVTMFGQDEGDRVLSLLADILHTESPEGAHAYRVGSDEFIVVVRGYSAGDGAALARRVCGRAASTIAVNSAPIGLSAGVAVCPDDSSDASTLVSRALACQQLARSAEGLDVVVYDAEVVDAADPLVRLEKARLSSHRSKLRALASALDQRDVNTRFRSEAVAEIARAFAQHIGLSAEQARTLEVAAQLHNIGYTGIPDGVLLKEGPLNDQEWAVVRQHPVLGEKLLAPAGMPEILPAVRSHHERWDGGGYPDGLIGPDIPLEARALAICDAFEAMMSSRRYRPAMTATEALEELEARAGTQFDPALVREFVAMVGRTHGRGLSDRTVSGRRVVRLGGQPDTR
jgi:diguanylate cyclase (GGDEF)-like protein